jgi:hypothetical protein
MKHEVQFTDILKVSVERFHENLENSVFFSQSISRLFGQLPSIVRKWALFTDLYQV